MNDIPQRQVDETLKQVDDILQRQVNETLKQVDGLLPKHMTRASGITLNVKFSDDNDPEWRVLIEFVSNNRGFTPPLPVRPSQQEALQSLVDWVYNLGTLDLRTRVSQGIAALSPKDLIRESALDHVFREVQFRTNNHDVVINLHVHKDGTFRVSGSSSIPTDEFEAHTKAFARSADFVRIAGLTPQPKSV